jgi:hypothetical protein
MINLLQSSHAQDSGIRVVAGFAAVAALFVVTPQSEDVIANPEGKASALDECGVILFPIAKAVSALGFLFLHKLRLPALPPSCLCNKANLRCEFLITFLEAYWLSICQMCNSGQLKLRRGKGSNAL